MVYHCQEGAAFFEKGMNLLHPFLELDDDGSSRSISPERIVCLRQIGQNIDPLVHTLVFLQCVQVDNYRRKEAQGSRTLQEKAFDDYKKKNVGYLQCKLSVAFIICFRA
jgi:hypothetical protein